MKTAKIAAITVFMMLSVQTFAQDDGDDDGVISLGGGYGENTRVVILTEVGIHLTSVGEGGRGLATNGLLIKTGTADAVGIALAYSLDQEQGSGTEIRYRHWFNRDQYIDAGIGFPNGRASSGFEWAASPSLLVKWNPVEWFGLALRPEYRRTIKGKTRIEGGQRIHYMAEEGKWSLSGGIEFCGKPGAIIETTLAVTLLAAIGAAFGS